MTGEWRRRCSNSPGCRYAVLYPGTHCPACGTPTVPWLEPETWLPPLVAAIPPRRPLVLDVPPLREILPVRRRAA